MSARGCGQVGGLGNCRAGLETTDSVTRLYSKHQPLSLQPSTHPESLNVRRIPKVCNVQVEARRRCYVFVKQHIDQHVGCVLFKLGWPGGQVGGVLAGVRVGLWCVVGGCGSVFGN